MCGYVVEWRRNRPQGKGALIRIKGDGVKLGTWGCRVCRGRETAERKGRGSLMLVRYDHIMPEIKVQMGKVGKGDTT